MPWALLLFALPLVFFSLMVHRVVRLGRLLRDPVRLRSLLSEEVRAALVEAGFDPDAVDLKEIQKSPELARLVAEDLRRLLRFSLLGLPLRTARAAPARPSGAAPSSAPPPGLPWLRPPPLHEPSGAGPRTASASALA